MISTACFSRGSCGESLRDPLNKKRFQTLFAAKSFSSELGHLPQLGAFEALLPHLSRHQKLFSSSSRSSGGSWPMITRRLRSH